LLTHGQTNKVWQKHNLLGRGNYITNACTKGTTIADSKVSKKFIV